MLPDEYKDVPDFTHVTGLEEGFPPPAPKEVTDEEMYELGLWERPPAPPPAPPPQPGQAAAGGMPDLANLDPQVLALLGGLLLGQGK